MPCHGNDRKYFKDKQKKNSRDWNFNNLMPFPENLQLESEEKKTKSKLG